MRLQRGASVKFLLTAILSSAFTLLVLRDFSMQEIDSHLAIPRNLVDPEQIVRLRTVFSTRQTSAANSTAHQNLSAPALNTTKVTPNNSENISSSAVLQLTAKVTMATHEDSLSDLIDVPFPLNKDNILIIGEQRQEKVFLTIGISSIHRQEAGFTYLKGTLQSLIDQTTGSDKRDVTVVVFLADFDASLKEPVIRHIQQFYQKHLDTGFIQIMQVSRDAYPSLEGLKRNYGDDERRVKWRSKQVVDFAFMFYHGRHLADYYIQIEDDVICAPSFVTHIRNYIIAQKEPWVNLEFSTLGFIGKLYKGSDLDQLARFMLLFYQEQPVDWLYGYFPRLLSYPKIPMRKPTLFQHMGEHSSLSSKHLNKLKDKFFAGKGKGKIPKSRGDVTNPPGTVFTSLEVYENYVPSNAYDNKKQSYFWGKNPQEGDEFSVIFNNPVKLKRVAVETGAPLQKNDYLRHGDLEASASLLATPDTSSGKPECSDYVMIGTFKEGSVEVNNIKLDFEVKCLRVRVTQVQEEWLIVYQIVVEKWT